MRDTSSAIRSQFGSVAANYRTSAVHAGGAELARMAAVAAEMGAPLALDLGCGAGHAAVAIAPACPQVIAYDLTAEMLAQLRQLAAEKALSNIQPQLGDVARLPFAGGAFALVVSRYSAHHWLELPQALAECRRVLAPAGRFLLCDIVAPEDLAVDTFLQTIEYLRDPSHVRDHRLSEWRRLLAAAGFAIRRETTWSLPLQLESWTARMATPAPRVALLRQLLGEASEAARRELSLGEEGWFAFPAVLLEAEAT